MRDFGVVLYGATGFTGRQWVKYFARHAPADVRWAIAGRSRSRLDQLEAGVPIIVADSAEQASIDAFVRRARIVVSTAGGRHVGSILREIRSLDTMHDFGECCVV